MHAIFHLRNCTGDQTINELLDSTTKQPDPAAADPEEQTTKEKIDETLTNEPEESTTNNAGRETIEEEDKASTKDGRAENNKSEATTKEKELATVSPISTNENGY